MVGYQPRTSSLTGQTRWDVSGAESAIHVSYVCNIQCRQKQPDTSSQHNPDSQPTGPFFFRPALPCISAPNLHMYSQSTSNGLRLIVQQSRPVKNQAGDTPPSHCRRPPNQPKPVSPQHLLPTTFPPPTALGPYLQPANPTEPPPHVAATEESRKERADTPKQQ